MKSILYFFWQCIWGCIQTFIGFIGFLINLKRKHYFYHGALVTEWSKSFSTSLGLFIFLSVNPPRDKRNPEVNTYSMTLVHEYGHTIQSLLLGPLYILIIGIPSSIWFMIPAFKKLRIENNISYFSFYTEKWANLCGEKVTSEISMQQARI